MRVHCFDFTIHGKRRADDDSFSMNMTDKAPLLAEKTVFRTRPEIAPWAVAIIVLPVVLLARFAAAWCGIFISSVRKMKYPKRIDLN